ncbi:traB domain-containing protein [Sorghum bicolor]|nr:traB domain-containing protein [Sorghum bicolor]|eukprot:XP_002441332.2 traB domain-containing protein [Sorghum bicolor]
MGNKTVDRTDEATSVTSTIQIPAVKTLGPTIQSPHPHQLTSAERSQSRPKSTTPQRRMIRAPRLLAGHAPSPIRHRLPRRPLAPIPASYRRLTRSPRGAFLAAQAPTPTPRLASSSRLGSLLGLPMDPAVPEPVPAPATEADADAETNVYEDAAEFEDAEAGGDGAGAGAGTGTGAGSGMVRAGGDAEMKELPEELAKGVVCLECETSAEAAAAGVGGTCRVYVVGTAHVSQESCDQVKAIVNYLKPQAVFLELCTSRIAILTPQNLQVPTMNEMIDMWKNKKMNTFGILYSWFLAKVASQLEVLPGAEFRVAFEEAMSYGGKVILGDRPVQITLRRTWGKMSLWHRAKFLYYIIFQSIFLPSPEELNKMLKDMDDVDMLTLVIQEMSKAFPSLMDTLLHERDMYMSSMLLKSAREYSSVVAVVGKGHVAGIKKNWQQPIQVKCLLELPDANQGPSKLKILASIGALSGVIIASGIYIWGRK